MEAMRWLSQGEPQVPTDAMSWLSTDERQRVDAMRYTKRRVEYLVARWTAKLAIAAVEGLPTGSVSLAAVEVGHAADGAPVAFVNGQALSRRVSLTDRAGWAVCGVSPSGLEVGCDLELVEPRSAGFVADYFTPAEQDLAHAAPSELDWQRITNLIWSAKESALKVLRTGLRSDTRSVEVTLGDGGRDDWAPLTVSSAEGSVFPGWWRQYGTFILTVAAAGPLAPPIALEDPPALAAATPLHSWVARPRT